MFTSEGKLDTCYPQGDLNQVLQFCRKITEENEQLKETIKELKNKPSNSAKEKTAEETQPKREYVYDTSIICGDSNEEKDHVIDALVELLNYRHGKKYLIDNSRCWYAAYRCLKHYRFLDSNTNLSDFIELINETVLIWIDDEARYDTLFCKDVNFRNINEDHPLRQNDPNEWERKYKFNKHLTSLKYGVKIKKFLNNKLKFEK